MLRAGEAILPASAEARTRALEWYDQARVLGRRWLMNALSYPLPFGLPNVGSWAGKPWSTLGKTERSKLIGAAAVGTGVLLCCCLLCCCRQCVLLRRRRHYRTYDLIGKELDDLEEEGLLTKGAPL